MEDLSAQQILFRLQEQRALTLAGMDTNPYNRREYEQRLSQIEDSIKQLHFSYSQQHSPHRTNNSPSDVMDKYQPTQNTQDSGIVTRTTSPGFDEDDSSTDEHVMYRWNRATQGAWDSSYPVPTVSGGTEQKVLGTQGDRVKVAMFPESVSEQSCVSIKPELTNVHRLTESTQQIKLSLTSLLQYKSDTEITTLVIPELLKVLKDPERDVLEKAALVIDSLAKNESTRQAIILSPLLLSALIQAVGRNVNDETAKLAANAISSISVSPLGVKLIHSSDGIPFIMSLLTSEVQHVIMFAITCLHNMLCCQQNSNIYKEEIRNRGGVQHLVRLLNGNRDKILGVIADCLHLLALNNEETKLVIYNYRGPALLIKIIAETNYEKLLWLAGRLIKILALCPNNKHAIVQAGGLTVLSKHLNTTTYRVANLYLRILLTLSDASRPEENLEPMVIVLLNLLQMKEDMSLITSAVGILSNVTCNNPQTKTVICDHNGIQILLRIVCGVSQKRDININSPQINELLEGIICTLRHVTSKHERAEFAQNEVRLQKGLDSILQLFLTTTHWTLIKACLGLLRNLSNCTHNRIELRKLSVIPQLIELLKRSIEILFKSNDISNSTSQEGVNMEDVLVLILATIEILGRDPTNRNLIGKHDIVPVLIRLLYSERKRIIEHSVGCLCELALDPYTVQSMERVNFPDILLKLIQRCQDETIEAYANMTLHRLSEQRSYPHKIMADSIMPGFHPSIVHPSAGNVTPIDMDYFGITDDPSLAYFNPETGYAPIPSEQIDYYGPCVQLQPSHHTIPQNQMQQSHGFSDPRVTPSFYLDKHNYYDINTQPMQMPYYPPEQDIGYSYPPTLEYPAQQNREFFPASLDASQNIFRTF